MGLLDDKSGIVMGVANKRSIAWSIARTLDEHGARIQMSYQKRVEERVQKLAEELDHPVTTPCDVTNDDDIVRLFEEAGEELESVDFLVHAIAYAEREDLEGRFIDTERENYLNCQEISSYSLPRVVREAEPLLKEGEGGNVLAMTFDGGNHVYPNYNVMGVAKAALESSMRYLASELGPDGVRVNAISAGPVKTLSARGIKGFNRMLEEYEENAPLGRNIDVQEVADTASFLLSDLASGITGEIVHVDAGYNIMGL